MHREEKSIAVDIEPSMATFIKQGFNHLVRWPLLNIGIVLFNTSTAVNEEWLTAVEYIPTIKIFYKYVHKILSKEVTFFIYFKRSQSESKNYITLHDLDYYIVDKNYNITLIDKPVELEKTLLHVFQDYKLKSSQCIELIAFSSGTVINDDIISRLTFLDIETFNKEYSNIKPIIDTNFVSRSPFTVISPLGKLTFFVETYSWFDFKACFKEIIEFLHVALISDIREHMIKIGNCNNTDVSAYNPESGMLFVNDLLTMNIVNFFGCDARLESYHRFDMTKVDIEVFIKALSDTFKKILSASNTL
ncbi:DNA-dependent RNA polymerase subunit rpo35 [Murmansk poxvirus]|uniref:DNA-directed RNA polymerase 35 kDa subunit n=1 Tax=Murmansk poxvirus TaxID=2025359 RepID=A0A223FMY6_9POXV|nr:DNA-dependent RNA polymerase subunit rpo35 [Murmansk poxvirus]AST09340.1 DNA-dependent RNA polymerase subunit rpo35 [Murmansk poxvirus]